MRHTAILLTLAVLLPAIPPAAAQAPPDDFWKAGGEHGVAAAGGPEAAEAAVEIMRQGGNAVDAAVAAILVLNVTDASNACFGGEVPILVYDAQRDVVEVICGLGAAPRLATGAYFERRGGIPSGGDPTTAAVPGVPGAVLTALGRYGTLRFAEAAAPMLRVLGRSDEDWADDLARTVRWMIEAEARAEDRLRGLRLAADCFYRGPIARRLDAWSRSNGGLLRYEDMATHVTRIEEPVRIDYRGYHIYKCGAWTQGPFLLQTLRLLEPFDLRSMGHNSADYIHVLVEAMKLGLADRDTYYADPHFVDVPLERLLSKRYADLRRPLIDMERASLRQRPGDPLADEALLPTGPADYRVAEERPRDTTTCVVADRHGNVVAATPSGWGGVLAGDTGVILGSRLRSFNTWAGHPNRIEPGKRPRITLTPTLALRGGRPVFAVSVAGGDWQDQVTLQVLLNHIEFGMSPAEAVTAPRFGTHLLIGSFNQPAPEAGKLSIYEATPSEVRDELAARGHTVEVVEPPLWHPVALSIDTESGHKQAAGDPRSHRYAAGY